MNNLYKYLLLLSFIGFNIAHANSTCKLEKEGYSVEFRKGKDVCYKYDRKTDTTLKMETQPPKSGNWGLLQIDKIGIEDIWKKIDSK